MAKNEKLITMSAKEFSRYEIIQSFLDKKITALATALKIKVSERQVYNMAKSVREKGATGLIHKNRGKVSNRKIKEEVVNEAIRYLKEKYSDFKPTFASEKLLENHSINLSKEKVRQIMADEGLWQIKPRKKNKKYRKWRPRKDYYGQMQQFDGSYHNWFEGRLLDEYGEPIKESCLLAAIDDATGQVTALEFAPSEGVIPVFSFWKGYFREKGKPLSIYLDKGSTYKVNFQHLLDDPWSLTQFEQAMNELEIEVIHAYSPQAKGRVERLFKTLQDRLIREMRLANISTIKENILLLQSYRSVPRNYLN